MSGRPINGYFANKVSKAWRRSELCDEWPQVEVDGVTGLHLQARNTQVFGQCALCGISSNLAQE
jgi:hypothetical protein